MAALVGGVAKRRTRNVEGLVVCYLEELVIVGDLLALCAVVRLHHVGQTHQVRKRAPAVVTAVVRQPPDAVLEDSLVVCYREVAMLPRCWNESVRNQALHRERRVVGARLRKGHLDQTLDVHRGCLALVCTVEQVVVVGKFLVDGEGTLCGKLRFGGRVVEDISRNDQNLFAWLKANVWVALEVHAPDLIESVGVQGLVDDVVPQPNSLDGVLHPLVHVDFL